MRLDQQRNIDSVRVANKTTLRFDATTVEFGVFATSATWIIRSFGISTTTSPTTAVSLARPTTGSLAGFRNRFIVGVNVLNGTIDNYQYVN